MNQKKRDIIIEKADTIVKKITKQYRYGLITDEERYHNTINIWSKVKSEVTEEMIDEYDEENDIFYQINSGARGNWGQVTQISGMKGLVANPAGRTIELPIRSNLKRGFSILEYFIATHAGRKGKSDTALKTAEAGYLTRRLVDSVQDVVVREDDSKPDKFRVITRQGSADLGIAFEPRILGRFLAEPVKKGSKTLLKKDQLLDEEAIDVIKENQIDEVSIHSVLYAKTLSGVCQKTYGYDLGHKKLVDLGTPIGIIAAQSIGEPGTQLTMRTFHMGGVATEGASITQGLTRVEELFEARSPQNPAVLAEISGVVSIKKGKNETQISIQADKAEEEAYLIPYEHEAVVKKGDTVKEKQIIIRSTESKASVKTVSAGEVVKVTNTEVIIKQDAAAKKVYKVSSRISLKNKRWSPN